MFTWLTVSRSFLICWYFLHCCQAFLVRLSFALSTIINNFIVLRILISSASIDGSVVCSSIQLIVSHLSSFTELLISENHALLCFKLKNEIVEFRILQPRFSFDFSSLSSNTLLFCKGMFNDMLDWFRLILLMLSTNSSQSGCFKKSFLKAFNPLVKSAFILWSCFSLKKAFLLTNFARTSAPLLIIVRSLRLWMKSISFSYCLFNIQSLHDLQQIQSLFNQYSVFDKCDVSRLQQEYLWVTWISIDDSYQQLVSKLDIFAIFLISVDDLFIIISFGVPVLRSIWRLIFITNSRLWML